MPKNVAAWEAQLTAEGMPAELPYNIAFSPELEALYSQLANEWQEEHGRPPTPTEVSTRLGQTAYQAVVQRFGAQVAWDEVSLEEQVRSVTPASRAGEDVLLDRVKDVLQMLTPRESMILRLRFGFEGPPLSIAEVAQHINTNEAVLKGTLPSIFYKLQVIMHGQGLLELLQPRKHSPLFTYQEPEVALFCGHDDRPYHVRLAEASTISVMRSYEAGVIRLHLFKELYLTHRNFLEGFVDHVPPDYAQYQREFYAPPFPNDLFELGDVAVLYDQNKLCAAALRAERQLLEKRHAKLLKLYRELESPEGISTGGAAHIERIAFDGQIRALALFIAHITQHIEEYEQQHHSLPRYMKFMKS